MTKHRHLQALTLILAVLAALVLLRLRFVAGKGAMIAAPQWVRDRERELLEQEFANGRR